VSDHGHLGIGSSAPGHYGPASTGVALAEATATAAWNAQGDAARPPFAEAARRLFGVVLPMAPNASARAGASTALWLGPTSWLLVTGDGRALTDFAAKRDALIAAGGALFDLTASRVAWTVSGSRAAAVLAKHCPLDFHPRAFAEGACAQSVLGHVNALFYKRDAAPSFTLMVARSLARDVWRTLCVSAAQYGYDVLPAQEWGQGHLLAIADK
jgi:sarcosine oxidase subunit gamma